MPGTRFELVTRGFSVLCSHGGGWDSTDAEVVNSATGADFREEVFLGEAREKEGEQGG